MEEDEVDGATSEKGEPVEVTSLEEEDVKDKEATKPASKAKKKRVPCPRCGHPLSYRASLNDWYCSRCLQFLKPMYWYGGHCSPRNDKLHIGRSVLALEGVFCAIAFIMGFMTVSSINIGYYADTRDTVLVLLTAVIFISLHNLIRLTLLNPLWWTRYLKAAQYLPRAAVERLISSALQGLYGTVSVILMWAIFTSVLSIKFGPSDFTQIGALETVFSFFMVLLLFFLYSKDSMEAMEEIYPMFTSKGKKT